MDKDEFLSVYTLLFENWRFQVSSNWQRTNYFAAFETAVLFGAWMVITRGIATDHKVPGCLAAFFGIVLTIIWLLNDIKAHSYIRYWWKTLERIERSAQNVATLDFVSEYKRNAEQYRVQRCRFIPYHCLMWTVPIVFLSAWMFLLLAAFGIMKI